MYTLKRPLHKPIWVHHANALASAAYRRLVRHHLFLCRQTTLPCPGKRASRPSMTLGRLVCPDRPLPGHKNLSPEAPGAGWHSVHGIAYANAIRCEGQHGDPQQPAYHACKPAGTELLGPWSSLQLSSSWQPALLLVAHPHQALTLDALRCLRTLQCTSPGHHASSRICHLQRLQRRWRSFWWLSRNSGHGQGPRVPSTAQTPPGTCASMPTSLEISSHS